jgi:cytochrome c556
MWWRCGSISSIVWSSCIRIAMPKQQELLFILAVFSMPTISTRQQPMNLFKLIRRALLLIILVSLGLVLLGGSGNAHEGAKGVVNQRMDLMTGINKNMKTITDMARGKTPFKASVIAKAATDTSKRAAHAPRLFPAGSLHKPSEARAEIWRNWSRFEQLAKVLESGANNLGRIASSATKQEDIASPSRDFSKVCRSCHERFRLKK